MEPIRKTDHEQVAPPHALTDMPTADRAAPAYPPSVPLRIWKGILVGLCITGALVASVAFAFWVLR